MIFYIPRSWSGLTRIKGTCHDQEPNPPDLQISVDRRAARIQSLGKYQRCFGVNHHHHSYRNGRGRLMVSRCRLGEYQHNGFATGASPCQRIALALVQEPSSLICIIRTCGTIRPQGLLPRWLSGSPPAARPAFKIIIVK